MAHAFSRDVQKVRDYYDVLDVPHNATSDEVRRAYRSLALQFHPDRNGGSRESEERFRELSEAFHTLSDPDRRELYDIWGYVSPGQRSAAGTDSAGLDKALAVFVDQFSAFVQEELPEMSDLVDVGASVPFFPLRVRVTLAEVATGACREVPLPCVRCSGTGVQNGPGPLAGPCPTCEGSGEDAGGETVRVDVPAGALAGDRVRVPRAGRGDLVAVVEVEEDPRFVRAGADVLLELAISERGGPGSEVEVPTPTGSTRVKIPRGTTVGGALRIPGHGLPARTRPGNGDLIVKLVAEGTEGAWTVAAPERSPAAARPTRSKAGWAGIAFVLGGVTVALFGRFGSEIASAAAAGFAATNEEPTFTPAPVSQVDVGAGEPDPGLDSGARDEASRTTPVESSPAFRVPSAPDLTDLSLPGVLDITPTYGDPQVASLSPIRPEVAPANTSGQRLTAITQVPRVLNADRVQESLEREYPIGLREAKIGGRVEMSFDIDARGRVERFQIRESSGHSELDSAATRVAQLFEFSPALRGTERVATSLALGITFGDGGVAAGTGVPAPGATTGGPDQPVPADFDVAPQVGNPERVQRALQREYPIGLRDAGVGGQVEMWFYVNQQGVVERFQIRQGSGTRALDEAAMRVARVFQFTPALRANQPIATWTALRITFVGADPH